MALNDVPKKPADQFVPKASPEEDDLFVFWDRITKKMARASITQFITWLKTQFTYAEAEHSHTTDEVEMLDDTLITHQNNIQTLQNEVAQINEVLNKPPAPPTNVDWVQEPTSNLVGTQVQLGTGSASFRGTTVNYAAATLEAGALPQPGNIRIDAIYGKEDGTFGLAKGPEGLSGTRGVVPVGALYLRDAVWTDQGGEVVVPEQINFDYTSYTEKATPADSAVFLVQETTVKHRWSLSQMVVWLATKLNLANKVDKVAGKQLSTEDYTTAEKQKLAGLESSHFKGLYTSLVALQAAVPAGVAGDYAHVDAGAGSNTKFYIWDLNDATWVEQAGQATGETAASIKTKYESNPDTNAFTDAEKTKLAGLNNVPLDEQPTSGSPNAAKSGGIFSWVNTQISAALGNGGSTKAAGVTAGTLTVNFDNSTDEIHVGQITGPLNITYSGTRLGNVKIINLKHDGSSLVTVNGTKELEAGFVADLGQPHKVYVRLGVNSAGTVKMYYKVLATEED